MFCRIVGNPCDGIGVGVPVSEEAAGGGRPVGEHESPTVVAIDTEHVSFIFKKLGEGELNLNFCLGGRNVPRVDKRGPV